MEPSEGCIGEKFEFSDILRSVVLLLLSDADDTCECVVVVETKGQHCELVEDLVCCLDHSQLTLPIRALIEVSE